MRCKACNKQLSDTESWWNEKLQDFNNLCGVCKPVSDQAVADIEAEEWEPLEPVYPHDLRWDGIANNPPDRDD